MGPRWSRWPSRPTASCWPRAAGITPSACGTSGSGKLVAVLHGLDRKVLCVKFSPDGKTVAASEGDTEVPHTQDMPCQIRIWDAQSHAEIRTLRGHSNSIPALAFSPDGKTLASGSMDQTVKLWDAATGKLRETIVPGETGTSSGMGGVGSVGSESTLIGADVAREMRACGECRRRGPEFVLPHGDKIEAWTAAYSPDGKTLVTSGSGGALMRWEVDKLPGGGTSAGFVLSGRCSAFSPDGKLFATGNRDHTISLWGADGSQLCQLKGHDEAFARWPSRPTASCWPPGRGTRQRRSGTW